MTEKDTSQYDDNEANWINCRWHIDTRGTAPMLDSS